MDKTLILTKITSSSLDTSVLEFEDQRLAYGFVGGKPFMVIGDGVNQAKDLPRFPSEITWGIITGAISGNAALTSALNAKLNIAQGIGNADKVAITDESGDIIFVTSPWPTFAEMESAIAAGSTGLFQTDESWEAQDLQELESWVTGGDAFDPINGREINNFDVYMVLDPAGDQYYFDSGAWIPFGVEMANYFTKAEANARFALKTDLDGKVNIAQGAPNANKLVVTDASGNVVVSDTFDGGTV